MGEWLAPGEVRLAAGEHLQTPTLFASCSVQGLNGLAANFHATVRSRLPWPGGRMRPRPVHLNTWEAVYFDHRTDDIRALAVAWYLWARMRAFVAVNGGAALRAFGSVVVSFLLTTIGVVGLFAAVIL